jgi:23S rRNA pseudouridine955/2504/2580 synthase
VSDAGLDHSKVQTLEVPSSRCDQRIDNYLLTYLKGLPKSRLYRLLRKGEVRVNGKRVQPDYRLQVGDLLRLPPIRLSAPDDPPSIPHRLVEQISQRIDPELLIIDKPEGLAVHGGSGVSFGVIDVLKAWRTDCSELFLAHRLDKDTSGCLMIAKTHAMLKALNSLQRDHHIKKTYQALLSGQWRGKPERTIHLALEKNQLEGGERVAKASTGGKEAITRFKFIKQYPGVTLVEATLETGRTHQIRVHVLEMGLPIVGDLKYGDKTANQHFRQRGIKRLCLHACRLQFIHPTTKAQVTVETPLDPALYDKLI